MVVSNELILNIAEKIVKSAILFISKEYKVKISYEISEDLEINATAYQDRIIFNRWIFTKIFRTYETWLFDKWNTGADLLLNKFLNQQMPINDEIRSIYLQILFESSCKIIIFHELTHIINGHLFYKAKINNEPLNKAGFGLDSYINNLTPNDSKALELNADWLAAACVIANLAHPESTSKIQKINPDSIKDSKDMLLLSIIWAIFTFLIIENDSIKDRTFNPITSTHLPAKTRAFYIYHRFQKEYEFFNGLDSIENILDKETYESLYEYLEKYIIAYYSQIKQIPNDILKMKRSQLLDIDCFELESYWLNYLAPSIKKMIQDEVLAI